MAENTSLTAEFEKASGAGSIKVEATEAGMDAGGFVGYMEPGAGLTIAGSSVDQVASDSGKCRRACWQCNRWKHSAKRTDDSL